MPHCRTTTLAILAVVALILGIYLCRLTPLPCRTTSEVVTPNRIVVQGHQDAAYTGDTPGDTPGDTAAPEEEMPYDPPTEPFMCGLQRTMFT
jgi:hypothetical protein